jgi:ABC-type transport system involved in cytochrome c biogenesis permease subunit
MNSAALYNISTAGYVASLSVFAVHLVHTRKAWLKIGVLALATSFLLQTIGMVFRWLEAGRLEIEAAEKAIGQALTGWPYFIVFTQHPPWSNLYEIMVYMSWGIILVTLMVEMRWHFSWVRQCGIILALLALGMASLTDQSIKPLVPALKSWWIMIHVISASIAYAAGFIAAFICLFAVVADQKRVSKDRIAAYSLILFGVLLFSLGGGVRLLSQGEYQVKLLAMAGQNVVHVLDMAKDSGTPLHVPMPWLGVFLGVALFTHIISGFTLKSLGTFSPTGKNLSRLYAVNFCFTLSCLLAMMWHDLRATPITVDGQLAHHLSPAGPWFIGFKSHPWSLGLMILVVILEGLILATIMWRPFFEKRLPKVEALEGASYRAISLSFFLMSVVLITGALWAHYAWGRYWAWDPKETGALAIWVTYAIYLHARRTPGLAGPFCSVLGIMGFFVIIIGFLGVNLGLFADGLHSYGSS